MAVLHNRVSQKELKQRMCEETEPRVTLSFYRYFNIPDPKKFRDGLYKALDEKKVFGRIYVAAEGINAQISLPQSHLEWFRNYCDTLQLDTTLPAETPDPAKNQGPGQSLENHERFFPLKDIRLNIAVDDDGKSFWVLKVKVRDKIVADGITDPSFDMGKKGRYVDAETFNRLTENPDTIVVDMRNHYEYEVGHFEGAMEVPSDTFREQLPMSVDMLKDAKEQPIIMYCTGGIRCEKASAWFLHKGFTNVFHLEGGIIHYANTIKEKGLPNKFRGKNFVFDDRLGERINDEIISHCHQCGALADTHTNCKNEGCHLLFIQCAACAEKYEGCCSEACLEMTHKPVEEQAEIRKGLEQAPRVFNKARSRNPLKHDPGRSH